MSLLNDPLRVLQADAEPEPPLWELFHENTKQGRYDIPPPAEAILRVMSNLAEALDYRAMPSVPLPPPGELDGLSRPLGKAIAGRASCRDFRPEPLDLKQVACLLYYACGANRDNAGTGFTRWFRNYPSGGALYPLEVYCQALRVDALEAGLYHYHPVRHELRRLKGAASNRALLEAVVQADVVGDASLVVMITAIFERSIFKYGERGYRLALLEAGHVAQNLALAAQSLNLGCLNIAGYYDREVDAFLGVDGIDQSTVYLTCLGQAGDQAAPTLPVEG